jgi:cytidylate kinase
MSLRNKAAKALYRAEQETQRYCELYGEDTDWEDDDSDDSDLV